MFGVDKNPVTPGARIYRAFRQIPTLAINKGAFCEMGVSQVRPGSGASFSS